ncbi:MAG: hypothetical protein QOH35_466 [Acidobacteriaceae bacterium]|jgi:hypothetical protein|nr:hypothetical protein [Acidobacteriaceae bacterium]MDX6462146.1 hypothetical protein [Acidobacteriaceae bacterium]MEA2539100.1 hypothetical protein [Acidobacteriaceae bacterium]
MIPRLSMAGQQPFDVDLGSKNAADKQPGGSSPAASLTSDHTIPLMRELGGWQLHRAGECRLGQRLQGLEMGSAARDWLQTFRYDTFAMTTMRKVLLLEGSSLLLRRLPEANVIEQVAHLLKSRRWHVCEPVMRVYPVTVSPEPQAASSAVPRRAPRQSEPTPPLNEVAEEPTLAKNADQAAIAGVLKQAATGGAPFCEECAKMASR